MRVTFPFDMRPKLTSLRDNEALHNAWSPIIAALFSGNSVVLKCSEHVVWSTTWFVQAIRECLKACGHDEELVQVRTLAYILQYGCLAYDTARLLLPRRGICTHGIAIHPSYYLHWL